MEALEDLESRIRMIGIKIMPIQIASIRSGAKMPAAWNNMEKIGGKISGSWQLKKSSWQIISENRR
ncbi:MAG: hypothetical protein AABX00_03015 [Nanoarchaeota archaeon]